MPSASITTALVLEQDLRERLIGQIIAVVTYALPEGTDRPTAVQMFPDSIPRYMATEGLLRKNV